MDALFRQIFTLLTTSPGNLAYHLVLAFSIAAALQVSLHHWRNSGYPQGRRVVIGLGLLLLARVVVFLLAGSSNQASGLSPVLLPVLDRAITAISLVLIVWLWVFPEPLRLADAAIALLAFLVIISAVFTTIWQGNRGAGVTFNGSIADVIWGSFDLGVMLIGALLLLARRPNGWGSGLGMLGLALAGHLIHLLFPQLNSDYPGAVRLTQMAAYPLLLTLPQRFAIPVPAPKAEKRPLIHERRRYSADPKVFQSFLALMTENDTQEIQRGLTRLISQVLLADVCLLINLPEEGGSLTIPHGYDLITESVLYGEDINSQQAPLLVEALRRGRPLRLPASSTSAELNALSRALKIERSGPLLAAPLRISDEEVRQGVVLLSPFSNRGWSSEDETHLLTITRSLAHLLRHAEQIKGLEEKLAQARQAAQSIQTQVEQSQRQTIAHLRAENERLGRAAGRQPGGTESAPLEENVEKKLRATLAENAALLSRLAEAEEKISILENAAPVSASVAAESPFRKDQAAVIAAIAQDLRQPMSSMLGYADLLLGESVGILGALQRKFLERIKAAVERMSSLSGELAAAISTEGGQVELTPRPVDLSLVIDESIAHTARQLRDKSIALRIDMPEQLPQLHADRDALQQVLINLLQNAGAVTPPRGEISLRARLERGDDRQDYLFLQVADMGGGIPPEDMKRLFSRSYRADTLSLRGLGEEGVGLAMVKSLIEAHGGRIWVDTEMGRGSTFSVLLPISDSSGAAAEAGGIA